MAERDIVFKRSDGSQVLVTIWANGRATMAEKPPEGGSWGPPIDSLEDVTYNAPTADA